MRLLKRQKGLPFLLALSVLFILSASFLAVQLWSDKRSLRGAVQALEAPVMPPAMPSVVAPPPVKKITKVQPAKPEVQPAEIKTEPVAAVATEPASADINAAEVKIATEASAKKAQVKEAISAPVVEQAKSVVAAPEKVEKVEKKPAPDKKSEKIVSAANKPEKQSKPAKRAKKAKKAAEVVPTEIPTEWNWFSKPLRLSFDGGKAVIDRSSELDKSISLSTEEKISSESSVVAADAVIPEEEKQSAAATVSAAEPSVEKPFMLALAKMARIRQMRSPSASVEDKAVVKPAQLSPSLRAMGSKLRELCEKLDKTHESAVDHSVSVVSEPVAAPVAAPMEAEKPAEIAGENSLESSSSGAAEAVLPSDDTTADPVLKPYYGGSGSSFSARINSMLKQGLIKVE